MLHSIVSACEKILLLLSCFVAIQFLQQGRQSWFHPAPNEQSIKAERGASLFATSPFLCAACVLLLIGVFLPSFASKYGVRLRTWLNPFVAEECSYRGGVQCFFL